MHRFHLAKIKDIPKVEVWGSGKPLREFLHVDDLSDACMFIPVTKVGISKKHRKACITHKHR